MKRIIIVMIAAAILTAGISGTCFGAGGNVRSSGNGGSGNMEVSLIDGKVIVNAFGEFGEKDWIGIYKQGEEPGESTPSLVWWYTGTAGRTVTLPDGLADVNVNRGDEFIDGGRIVPGEYRIIALADDGYGRIGGIEIAEITVSPAEADIAIDYDASTYIGGGFQDLKLNGISILETQAGRTVREVILANSDAGGKLDDTDGTLSTLELIGWAGFEQAIVAFGSIVNGQVNWDDSFMKDASDDIRSEDMGGRYAKKFDVQIEPGGIFGDFTVGVIAALADGTLVKLNSALEPGANTFITFSGPARPDTPTPEASPTAAETPVNTAAPATAQAETPAATGQPGDGSPAPETGNATSSANTEPTPDGSGDNADNIKSVNSAVIIAIAAAIACVLIIAAVLLILKGKKK